MGPPFDDRSTRAPNKRYSVSKNRRPALNATSASSWAQRIAETTRSSDSSTSASGTKEYSPSSVSTVPFRRKRRENSGNAWKIAEKFRVRSQSAVGRRIGKPESARKRKTRRGSRVRDTRALYQQFHLVKRASIVLLLLLRPARWLAFQTNTNGAFRPTAELIPFTVGHKAIFIRGKRRGFDSARGKHGFNALITEPMPANIPRDQKYTKRPLGTEGLLRSLL